MKLLDFYPSPLKLLKSEVRVLNHLRNDPYIQENHSQFAQDAGRYYDRCNGQRGLEFSSILDVSHAPMRKKPKDRGGHTRWPPNLRLILSARIEVDNGAFTNITYCLVVCRIIPKLTILRKFHFDVTVPRDGVENRSQPQPLCHLQYCGSMLPIMNKMGFSDAQLNQMCPWLSEPRVFFWPMSLALLIDMALHEFPDQRSAKFRQSSEWRSIIQAHEKTILRPFYKKCVEVIDNHDKKKSTLADAFYIG